MSPGLVDCLREFFQTYLREHRGVSPNTVKSYGDTFRFLIAYAGFRRRGPRPLSIADLDAKLILDFLQNLEDPERGRANCARSRNQRLAAIQCFFKFLALRHPGLERQAKRIFAIPAKRFPPRQVLSLSRAEVEALLAQPRADTPDGFRDLAMLTFLYNTGARAQEAADARISWFDLRNRTVTILGKGNKQRVIPLWSATARLLAAYQQNHRRKPKTLVEDRFFINQRSGPFTRFGIRAVVKKYLALASRNCPSLAGKRLSTHSLRHTCACHMLEAGVDPNVIKEWLGHASLLSTGPYLNIDLNYKRQILEQFGPPDYVQSVLRPGNPSSVKDLLDWLGDLSTGREQ